MGESFSMSNVKNLSSVTYHVPIEFAYLLRSSSQHNPKDIEFSSKPH